MSGAEALAIHGIGYIGASAAAFFSARGIRVIGIDPDAAKVAAAREGRCPAPGLAVWLEAAGVPFRTIGAVTSVHDLPQGEVAAHHVCVPTEAEGAASEGALHQAMRAIYCYDPRATVVIESTIPPAYLDEIAIQYPGVRVVVAPRRDWFDAPDKNMATLPRVLGADDRGLAAAVADYLGLVCDVIVSVPGARDAALVKCVENGIRQVELAYANELALTLSDRYDVRAILAAAATKWNIGEFRPSIGIGGYCLPLAPRYLATADRALKLSTRAVQVSEAHVSRMIDFLSRFRQVDFWTLAYKANGPFTTSSPAVWIAEGLTIRQPREGVRTVGVFPRDKAEQDWIGRKSTLTRRLEWPKDAGSGDVLVIPVAHAEALALNDTTARETVGKYRLVIDNEDALARISPTVWHETQTDIRVPGRKGWLA